MKSLFRQSGWPDRPTLIHMRIAKAELIVTEVSSFEHLRIHGNSNLSTFGDGFRILQIILTERRGTKRKSAFGDIPEVAPFQCSVITQPFYESRLPSAVSGELHQRVAKPDYKEEIWTSIRRV